MSDEVIKATFRQVFASRLVQKHFTVVWHAGEPCVLGVPYYENAVKIIEELKPRDVEVTYSVQTNGSLVSDAWCEFFKKHRFQVGVSVDGPEFIHDRHRKTRNGSGTHKKIAQGMQLLQKHGIDFAVISVLTREALDYPDEMFSYFVDNKLFRVGFNVEEKEGVHTASTLDGTNIQEKLTQFLSRFYDLNEASGRKLLVREFSRFEKTILSWSMKTAKQVATNGIQDSAPFKIISVDCDGGYCTYSPELVGVDVGDYGKFEFGNVTTDPFDDAVKNLKFRAVESAIQAGMKKCEATCEYFSACGGGSPANKFYENGTFDSAETMHCRLQVKAISELVLGKLTKNFVQRQKGTPA